MKNLFQSIGLILCLCVSMISCNDSGSIQKYYIEKQESAEFISFDIPASVVTLSEDASEDTKEALASIKKLNILAYPINENTQQNFDIENKQIKNILNDSKFNELMRVKHDGVNIQVKYLGDDESIDELIVFASDKTKGFALARVLGEHMRPEKIMKLIDNIKDIDKNSLPISQIEDIIGKEK